MLTRDGNREPTPMAYEGDGGALRGDPLDQDARRAGVVPAGPLHAAGAGDPGAPLAGGEAPGRGAAVPGGGGANGRVDHDGDAGGAVAAARRGRLSARSRSDFLRVAVPVKGRLREPAFKLLE